MKYYVNIFPHIICTHQLQLMHHNATSRRSQGAMIYIYILHNKQRWDGWWWWGGIGYTKCLWHRKVSLNPSGRSTIQMMLPNRMLSYQAKLQNCHEFIHSNLLSDSGFSIISIVEFQRNQKQKIGVVLIVKAANGEKIIRPNFCAYICSLNQAYCPPAISGY